MTAPPPSARSARSLRLTAGVYVFVLAATLIVLAIRLSNLRHPEPIAEKPVSDTPADVRNATADAAAPEKPHRAGEPKADAPARPGPSIPDANEVEPERRPIPSVAARVAAEPVSVPEPPTETTGAAVLDRSGDTRRRRIAQFGGSRRTEDAVEAGLAWLAAHQDDDGAWDRFAFGRHCPPDDRCAGAATHAKDYSFRPGLTGLALLAFLGAGYTDREGPYQDTVARAVAALLEDQGRQGGFGRDNRMSGYNDALATFALAEYLAMTRDPRVVAPLERAVQRLVLTQQELGGWDYLPRNDSGRNDTSITAWAVQALHACVAAGIHVPRRALVKAALHFERASEANGLVRYSDAGIGFKIDERTLEPVYRYGPAMLAAGLTCEQLLGWRLDGPLPQRQHALLAQQPPSITLLQGGDPTELHSYYYWYYGTIAAFQIGGDRWDRWNAALRDAALTLQNRERKAADRKSHAYGSWPPFGQHWGKWGRQGSRVYSTALCVLTLEIYYRQTPAYLEDHAALDSRDWLAFMAEADERDRRRAIQALQNMRVEIAEPAFVELLSDGDRSLARAVAVALTTFGSPLGKPVLEDQDDSIPAWERQILDEALRRVREIEALPPVHGTVRVFDAERSLATVDVPRAYAGMVLDVRRDGHPVARMRVIKRFSDTRVVVAELVDAGAQESPRQGDTVVGR